MMKDFGDEFNDYSISSKIKQIWVIKDVLPIQQINWKRFFSLVSKMSYHQFNKKEILQKTKEKYCKEKTAEYYLKTKKS